jgi:hypothetical protein
VEVFDTVEHSLDGVAFFVSGGIEGASVGCACSAWDHGNSGSDGVQRTLSVISLVCEDGAGAKATERRFYLGDLVLLAAAQEHLNEQPNASWRRAPWCSSRL